MAVENERIWKCINLQGLQLVCLNLSSLGRNFPHCTDQTCKMSHKILYDCIHNSVYSYYGCAKFLLAVMINGSACRHLISSKTFKNNRNKLKYIFMTILKLAESLKTMNRPNPTVTIFHGLFIGNIKET